MFIYFWTFYFCFDQYFTSLNVFVSFRYQNNLISKLYFQRTCIIVDIPSQSPFTFMYTTSPPLTAWCQQVNEARNSPFFRSTGGVQFGSRAWNSLLSGQLKGGRGEVRKSGLQAVKTLSSSRKEKLFVAKPSFKKCDYFFEFSFTVFLPTLVYRWTITFSDVNRHKTSLAIIYVCLEVYCYKCIC